MRYLNYSVEDFLTDASFINYLEQINEQDVLYWEKIIKENQQLVEKVEEAKKMYLLLSVKRENTEKQEQLNRLKFFIEAPESRSVNLEQEDVVELGVKATPKIRRMNYLMVAAIFLALLGVTFVYFQFKTPQDILAFNATEQSYNVIAETKFGERRTIVLSDGSTVILNSSSLLSVAKDYNQQNRVVKLSGEAFFEVAKDKARPFMVIANNTITKALGTSFKIKNYNNDNQDVSISLATGKVSVKEIQDKKEVLKEEILNPGEELKVYSYKSSEKVTFDQQELVDWKEKNISFSMATLNEVKDRLHEVYGILIITTNNSANKNYAFTGSFKGQDLKDVLDAMAFVNNFNYKIDEKKVYITFN